MSLNLQCIGYGWGKAQDKVFCSLAQDPEARLLLSSLKGSFLRAFLTKGLQPKWLEKKYDFKVPT